MQPDDLRNWLAENRPDLWAEVISMDLWQAAGVLMRETGIVVGHGDLAEEACQRFLEALKEQQSYKESK